MFKLLQHDKFIKYYKMWVWRILLLLRIQKVHFPPHWALLLGPAEYLIQLSLWLYCQHQYFHFYIYYNVKRLYHEIFNPIFHKSIPSRPAMNILAYIWILQQTKNYTVWSPRLEELWIKKENDELKNIYFTNCDLEYLC